MSQITHPIMPLFLCPKMCIRDVYKRQIFDNVLQNRATKAQTDCVLINASFAIQAMEPAKPIEE